VDQETIRLIEELHRIGEDDRDEFWKDLEEEQQNVNVFDKLVFLLSGGDIVKAKSIWKTVTLNEGVEWLLMIVENRPGIHGKSD